MNFKEEEINKIHGIIKTYGHQNQYYLDFFRNKLYSVIETKALKLMRCHNIKTELFSSRLYDDNYRANDFLKNTIRTYYQELKKPQS